VFALLSWSSLGYILLTRDEKWLLSVYFARQKMDILSFQMKRLYDRVTYYHPYEEGDVVWYHDPKRVKGKSPKLQKPWVGPMVIVKKINDCLFKIKKTPSSAEKSHDRLKPYEGCARPTGFKTN
jgi:hypothetical protein